MPNDMQKVRFDGKEWFYQSDMRWHVEKDGLSNNGIWRIDGSLREQKREGIGFNIDDLEIIHG